MAHLATNGGIQGYSAGASFPLRVVAQGTPDALVWHVVGACGASLSSYGSACNAHAKAYALHALGIWTRDALLAFVDTPDACTQVAVKLTEWWVQYRSAHHTRHDYPRYYGLRDRHGRPYAV